MSDIWTNNYTANRSVAILENPMYAGGNEHYMSDFFIENASFLKLDNVTAGYTIPIKSSWYADRAISLNIFATVQNVLTLTRYTGIDPEVYSGIDNNMYPRPRNYMLGVKFNF